MPVLPDPDSSTAPPGAPSTDSAPVKPRHSRRKDARPAELLAAALQLFVRKGYAATRVEEVAALAGVSKGTLFLYYPSKLDLFKAVVRTHLGGRMAEWKTEIAGFDGRSSDLLRHAFARWWALIGSTELAGITKLMHSEAVNFPELAAFYLQEVVLPGQALVRGMLARGVADGEFRPLDLDAAVHLVLAPMAYWSSWKYSLGQCQPHSLGVAPERYLQAQLDNLLRGLLAQPLPSSAKDLV